MKKFNPCFSTFITIVLMLLFTMPACGNWSTTNNKSAVAKQAQATRESMEEAMNELGMPNIVNYQQKKTLKWIQELCDQENLITYSYVKNEMTGKFMFMYETIGYGIPFAAQYTSPSRLYDVEKEGGANQKQGDSGEIQVIPQEDPNGIYMPTSADATWVIIKYPGIDELKVSYSEPLLTVVPIPMRASLVQNPEDYALYGITPEMCK